MPDFVKSQKHYRKVTIYNTDQRPGRTSRPPNSAGKLQKSLEHGSSISTGTNWKNSQPEYYFYEITRIVRNPPLLERTSRSGRAIAERHRRLIEARTMYYRTHPALNSGDHNDDNDHQ
ncbi:hypothetical protein I4U23_027987 [Adineta vaga]|nr:hypothetical protein I4U23_027987 [Adineta vaga]